VSLVQPLGAGSPARSSTSDPQQPEARDEATRTASSVASALVELLAPWVGHAFNVAGAANVPFITAWSERGLPWFTALEEKRGLTMAEGYSRASGKLALMTTTAGPGVTNLATGLLLALRERTPVFVVSGQTPTAYASRRPVQQLDTKPFARELTLRAHELTAPEQLHGFVAELLQVALDRRRRGPVLLAIPADLWQRPCPLRRAVRFAEAWSINGCRRCATALLECRRPLIIAGTGVVVAGAGPALLEFLAALPAARVATTPRALGAVPSSHPGCIGSIGFGGRVDQELEDFDLLLVLGSRLHEMSTNYDERIFSKRLLQIDIDPEVLVSVGPVEGYCADVQVALKDLTSCLLRHPRALSLLAERTSVSEPRVGGS
jgi:thiamine pyrophosphate-dependent acetolactate synthase large subunit-like protein